MHTGGKKKKKKRRATWLYYSYLTAAAGQKKRRKEKRKSKKRRKKERKKTGGIRTLHPRSECACISPTCQVQSVLAKMHFTETEWHLPAKWVPCAAPRRADSYLFCLEKSLKWGQKIGLKLIRSDEKKGRFLLPFSTKTKPLLLPQSGCPAPQSGLSSHTKY